MLPYPAPGGKYAGSMTTALFLRLIEFSYHTEQKHAGRPVAGEQSPQFTDGGARPEGVHRGGGGVTGLAGDSGGVTGAGNDGSSAAEPRSDPSARCTGILGTTRLKGTNPA